MSPSCAEEIFFAMKLKVFTLRLDPATGAFDGSALDEFCKGREILDVREEFFVHEQVPTWALMVSYREDRQPGAVRRTQDPRTDWRATLAEDERPLFDALRRWRGERAQQSGKPSYILLTNRQMAEIARRRPGSLAAFQEVQGIGEVKARDLGQEVLALVAASTAETGAPSVPAEPREETADGA